MNFLLQFTGAGPFDCAIHCGIENPMEHTELRANTIESLIEKVSEAVQLKLEKPNCRRHGVKPDAE